MSDIRSKVSPIVAIAATSVIVLSALGIGVLTGIIPSSFSNTEKHDAAQAPASATQPARTQAVAPQAVAPQPAAPSAQAERKARRAAEDQRPARERTRVAANRACAGCGTVRSVNAVEKAGEGSGLGAVAGGVVGGVLGNQIGDGSGRRVATVAGVAGGAYAGHQVEKHVKTSKTWNVAVRMEDGSTRSFPYASEPGFRAGDAVKVVKGKLEAR